jgi:putative transport protein
MIQLLLDNPLLLLFLITAVGYPLGRIKIGGSSLGVTAVLFVGLAAGALNPNLGLPDIIYLLGLIIFVYTIGLTSGPSFFASLRHKGVRDNLLIIFVLVLAMGLVIIARNVLNLTPGLAAGLFTGNLTNTPALAGVLDYIQENASPANLQSGARRARSLILMSPRSLTHFGHALFPARTPWRLKLHEN